jgi:hypothetical protein
MPPFADRQIADADGADGRAHQLRYLAVHSFEHAPHLPVTPLGDGDFQVRVLGTVAQTLHFGRPRGAVGQFHSVAQFPDLFVAQQGGGFHLVGLGHFVVGIGNALRESGVVGEQQQPAGIQVQAPHRGKPRAGIGRQSVDGGPSLGVAPGGQISFGFVQQDVGRLGGGERFAVQSDAVLFQVYPMIGVLHHFSVDANAAGADPTAGVGARSQSCLGKDSLQSFERSHGSHNGTVRPSVPQF